jgi:hypothetical protein
MLRIFGLDGSADLDDGGIGWQGIVIPDISKRSFILRPEFATVSAHEPSLNRTCLRP